MFLISILFVVIDFWTGSDAVQAGVTLIHSWGYTSISDSPAPFFPGWDYRYEITPNFMGAGDQILIFQFHVS